MEDLVDDLTAAKAVEIAARARNADRERHTKALEAFLHNTLCVIDGNARCGFSRCRVCVSVSQDFSGAYKIERYRSLLEKVLKEKGFGCSTQRDYVDIWWEEPQEEDTE